MGFVERRTIARFIYPEDSLVRTEDVEVPPGDRDPDVPIIGGPPSGALGVRFFDQVVVEVDDPHSGTPIICCSKMLNPTPGVFYYRGLVATLEMVETGLVIFPTLMQQSILSQVTGQGWNHFIYFEGGKIILSYDPRIDLSCSTPHYFQLAQGLPPDGILGPLTKLAWMELVEKTKLAGNPLGQ